MGFGDVQALNPASQLPTPHLDALARAGMTFRDAHSPSAVCTPTRYGLITGRYCWRTKLKKGVLGGYSRPLLEAGRATIASVLKQHGYRTAGVGKWHLGMDLPMLQDNAEGRTKWEGDPGIDFSGVITDSPTHHGFDYYFGVSASLDMAPYVFIRNDRFTQLPTLQQPAVSFPHFVRKGPRAEDFKIDEVLDRITDEATAFIRREANTESPFFLYVPFTAPHKPTQPHARFQGRTKLGEYGDFVVQTDWSVGQILKAIDDAGIADDTVVIFTSDNGSYMHRQPADASSDHVSDAQQQAYFARHHRANGPFRGTKADIYEAGHHVPFFVRWPDRVPAGSACDQTICHTDIFSTCLEIAGIEKAVGDAPDSYSFLPMLRRDPDAKRGAPVIHHSAARYVCNSQWQMEIDLGQRFGWPRKTPWKAIRTALSAI